MEASTCQACVFILTTYDDGERNKFNDSTFRLRVPFKPNINWQYKVTINECLFKNNEPLLLKNEDYIEFEIITTDGRILKQIFYVSRDIIVNSERDEVKAIKALSWSKTHKDNSFIYCIGSDNPITEISLVDEDGIDYADKLKTYLKMILKFDGINVRSVAMRYSTNYGYLLNNLRSSDLMGNVINTDGVYTCEFSFNNPRLGGPYLYVLKTPLHASVPTYNAVNQGYNVVACVYNTVGYHNQIIQMSSSMEVVAKDLSNLRIELVNDQYEKVDIKSPMYIQFTVSNAP